MAATKAEAVPAKSGDGSVAPSNSANPAAARSGMAAWIPVIAAVVLATIATWATVEFVVLPRLQKKMATAPAEGAVADSATHGGQSAPAAAGHGAKPSKEGKGGKETGGGPANYEFQNVVVNLAGTMGTRYLKTSFIVTAAGGADIRGQFEGSKARLTDITLNVLSSLTLPDLEEPGSKNVIREKLVMAYNQALGKKIADQVYFSDFVVQ